MCGTTEKLCRARFRLVIYKLIVEKRKSCSGTYKLVVLKNSQAKISLKRTRDKQQQIARL